MHRVLLVERRWLRRIGQRAVRPRLEGMEERCLLSTYTVSNTNDDANAGSLRWAIQQVDSGAGGDTIAFKIPGAGVQIISLAAALPTITQSVTIDGTTQATSQGALYTGTPLIELSGQQLTGTANGLAVSAGNSRIVALAINGFKGNGIALSNLGGNTIEGDFIGTDPTGTTVVGNGGDGILVQGGTNNLIDGTQTNLPNLISGNQGNGIETSGDTTGLTVIGNKIGTDLTGTVNLGNRKDGVHLVSSHNVIGGLAAGDGNVIAFNGNPAAATGAGVGLIQTVFGNTVLSNSIFSNGGQGISLGAVGNDQQIAPTLNAASATDVTTNVSGTMSGVPNMPYTLQFFSSSTAQSQGFGPGQTFLGTQVVTTDGNGNSSFNVSYPVATPIGSVISATATSASGDTSQFARNVNASGTSDVSVSIAPSADVVSVGDTITYTVTVRNGGPTVATGVTLTDLLPTGTKLLSAQSAAGPTQFATGSVTFSLGTLDVNQTVTATIQVQTSSASGQSVVNNVAVGCSSGDPDSSNNLASASTAIQAIAGVSLVMTGPTAPVPVGQNATYTVTLTNAGPADATSVVLTDVLPQNVVLQSATSTQGTPSVAAGVLTLNVGTMTANGTPVVLTLVVTPTVAAPPSITNSASVTDDQANPDPQSGSATITTTVSPQADLAVLIVPSATSVSVGQNVTYTVTLTNQGPSPATGVSLVDTLPANATLVSAVDDQNGTPVVVNGKVTDAIGALAVNDSVTLTIVITTTPGTAPTAPTATDSAVASANEADGDTTNNTATVVTTVVPVVDLSVGLTATPGSVNAGGQVTYVINVTNQGPSPATGVKLTDVLPANVSVVSAITTTGTIAQTASSVTATLGTLAANATATLTIIIATSGSTAPSITDTVSATLNETDSDPTDNSASAVTQVIPSSDLAVTVQGPTGSVLMNQNVTYVVTVANVGPNADTGVILTDSLPAGATFVSAHDSLGNDLVPTDGVLTDNLGDFDADAIVTLTIVVTPTAPGAVLEQAGIAGDLPDPNSGNDDDSVTLNVLPVANLFVTLVADKAQIFAGQPLTYTATITNQGPLPATGVTLADLLPPGMSIVSTSHGPFRAGDRAVGTDLGTLAVNDSITFSFVVVPTLAGSLSNTITATANEANATPGNATASTNVAVVAPGVLQFTAPSLTVNNNAGSATLTVTRTNGSQGTVSVDFTTVGFGSAVAGNEFLPVSGTLVFQQGETTKSFSVPIPNYTHDRGDVAFAVSLGNVTGGATLGSQSSAGVAIHVLNPDLVAPSVQQLQLVGPSNAVTSITLHFTEGLNASAATDLANYQLAAIGPGNIPISIASAAYDPSTNSVTLTPAVRLSLNQFFAVSVTGITDIAGNVIASTPGGTPGTGYSEYFARGNRLQYSDSQGHKVTLNLKGGGVLDLTRAPNGDGDTLQVLVPSRIHSVLSGKVSRGTTPLNEILGLGSFGQVKIKMTTPPFQIASFPFKNRSVSVAAYDVVLTAPAITHPRPRVKKAIKVHSK